MMGCPVFHVDRAGSSNLAKKRAGGQRHKNISTSHLHVTYVLEQNKYSVTTYDIKHHFLLWKQTLDTKREEKKSCRIIFSR